MYYSALLLKHSAQVYASVRVSFGCYCCKSA